MSLPNPIPDDPRKWDGWRDYSSEDYYKRLGLSYEENPTNWQIEENCRQLLVWWQKKLPLKNQPSNPLAQLLREGLDDASRMLVEARTLLLDPIGRATFDALALERYKDRIKTDFKKYVYFALSFGTLFTRDEENLLRVGLEHGLSEEEIAQIIEEELQVKGAVRVEPTPTPEQQELPPPQAEPQEAAAEPKAPQPDSPEEDRSPAEEFRRILKMSGLNEDGLSEEQLLAFTAMGVNIGLSDDEAENLLDDYLNSVDDLSESDSSQQAQLHVPQKNAAPEQPKPAMPSTLGLNIPKKDTGPKLSAIQERAKYEDFSNTLGMEMRLITSGSFTMGNSSLLAMPHEKPEHKVEITRFYMAKFPVTNQQYEVFDPEHHLKRTEWSEDDHPVINVTSEEALQFCQWLSDREESIYRLPTEAEWEYAARGTDGRAYPWGNGKSQGYFGNFADSNTRFAWSDHQVNDGFAYTSPVGSFPRGASPFGIEDMGGNVWEWCSDFYAPYKLGDNNNPKGPPKGDKRVCRGGSWRSKFANMRASARHSNPVGYAYIDQGFRVVRECK